MGLNKKSVGGINSLTFLEEGKFTMIDDKVREIASKMLSADIKSELGAISKFVSSLDYKPSSKIDFRHRTGSQVLASGYSTGCTDDAIAFIVIARSLGIPARYVETLEEDWVSGKDRSDVIQGHIFVDLFIKGKWVAYDPRTGFTKSNKYILATRNGEMAYKEIGKGLDFSEVYLKELDGYRATPINLQDVEKLKAFKVRSG
ncbi:MAG: transglutaminase-like domain-containing protein [Candidatus Micrarchaeaceae archaeon]